MISLHPIFVLFFVPMVNNTLNFVSIGFYTIMIGLVWLNNYENKRDHESHDI